MEDEGLLKIEGARIIFRNFAGKETQYNREGDRNFSVIIPPEIVEELRADGWNVKALKERDGAPPDHHMKVSVSYKGRPPRVVLVTSRGRTDIGQEEIEVLDWVDIATVDLIVRPFRWAVRGDQGISAYLKTMYITIREDDLEMKYADLEELPPRSGRVDE